MYEEYNIGALLPFVVAFIVLMLSGNYILGRRSQGDDDKIISDEVLFKEHPPITEECPICMVLLPRHQMSTVIFKTCCGKHICTGCIYAMYDSENGGDLCPFCRSPEKCSDQEKVNRIRKLMDKGNACAFNCF